MRSRAAENQDHRHAVGRKLTARCGADIESFCLLRADDQNDVEERRHVGREECGVAMSDVTRTLQIQGEAARSLLANVRDVIGDDEEMIATVVEGETGLIEAISASVDRMRELEGHSKAIDYQLTDLKLRQSRFDRQAERIKAAIHVAMGQAEIRKLELPQATLSLRSVAPSAEITDEALIPSKFWKAQDPKLDKKAVLDALKAKEDVPGAVLSNGGETIAIKST